MAAQPIIKPAFNQNIARTIYNGVLSKSDLFYYFIGKVVDWGDSADLDMATKASLKDENDLRRSLYLAKKIDINDVSLMIDRVDWEAGTIYDMYDDNIDVENPAFSGALAVSNANIHVLNSEFNVYKCIYNNANQPSTIEPTGTDIDYIETADGYVWKFVSFMPLILRNKFLIASFMPIQTAYDNRFYRSGGIGVVVIDNGGTGYDDLQTSISVAGDGVGAAFTPVITDGVITNVIVDNPGTGYTTATLTVVDSSGNPGSGAVLTAQFIEGDLDTAQANIEELAVDGSFSWVMIEDGGSGYTSATVTFDGDGTGAAGTVSIANGAISRINITNFGSGYTYATATITGDGSGAVARVIISPPGGHGSNVLEELGADTVCFYGSLGVEKNHGLSIVNPTRQVGIIKNPETYSATGDVARFRGDFGTYCFAVEGTIDETDWTLDQTIQTNDGSKKYRIVEKTSNKLVLLPLNDGAPAVSDVLYDEDIIKSFTITSVTDPDVEAFSGRVLYIDNQRSSFTPTPEQLVVFRSFVRV